MCVCEWRETQEGGEKEGRRPPYILPLARPHSPPPLFTGMPLHAVPDPGQRFRGHGAGDHVGGDRGRDGRHVKEKAEMDMMADGKRVFVLFFCFRRCESVCRVAPSILFRVCGERSVNHLGECVDGGAWACVDVSLRRKKVGRLVEGLNNNNNNNNNKKEKKKKHCDDPRRRTPLSPSLPHPVCVLPSSPHPILTHTRAMAHILKVRDPELDAHAAQARVSFISLSFCRWAFSLTLSRSSSPLDYHSAWTRPSRSTGTAGLRGHR